MALAPAVEIELGRPAPGRSAVEAVPLMHTRKAPLSIRWIVTFASVALITAAVLGVGAVTERNARLALTHEIETRLLLEARNLALSSTEPLLADFPELALHPLVKGMKARQPELALVLVLDHSGLIQGDPDVRRLGGRFTGLSTLKPIPSELALAPGEALLADGDVLVATAPVTHGNGRQIGTTIVGLRRDYLDRRLRAARQQQIVVLGIALLVGAVAAFLLMAWMLRPLAALRSGIQRIARGDLKTPLQVRDKTELGMLADAVNHMAGALSRAQAQMLERERLAHEVELARQIQSSLLPSGKTEAGSFVIEGSQRAATEVGGDYYDVIPLAGGRIGIAVADVAGKGLAGCLVMSMLSALLRAYRDSYPSPSQLLAVIDERLAETLQVGSFVTMFYGVLDPESGELVWASAGHSPLLVYRRASGTVEWLKTGGIPLGAIRGGAIRGTLCDATFVLGPGDILVQFTDGVNEAFGPDERDQFGFERMARVVTETAAQGGTAVIAAMHGAVETWTGSRPRGDDETVLVVSRELPVRSQPKLELVVGGASPTAERTAPTPPRLEAVPSAKTQRSGAPATTPIATPAHEEPEDHTEALAKLATAKRLGLRLELQSELEAVDTIRGWVASLQPAGTISDVRLQLLGTALYEACANIVEHGSVQNPAQRIELWWVPEGPSPAVGAGPAATGSSKADAGSTFVIRDHGIPFRADNWKATDFTDPEVWKRGRGFGLDIIHRVMHRVDYHPGTPEGNITVMRFLSNDAGSPVEEQGHV